MTITSPSGKEYVWDKPIPPTKEDIAAIVAYDASVSPKGKVKKSDIPSLSAYTPQDASMLQRLREFVSPLVGPTENQRLAAGQQAAALQQMIPGVGQSQPSSVQRMGAIPAIAGVVAQATDPMALARNLGMQESTANDIKYSGAATVGAIKGASLGRPIGPWGTALGSAGGAMIGAGAEGFRQYAAGQNPNVPSVPQIIQTGLLSAEGPITKVFDSRLLNAITTSAKTIGQISIADQARSLIDTGKLKPIGQVVDSAELPAFISAVTGGLTKTGSKATKSFEDARRLETAKILKDKEYKIPMGISEGEGLPGANQQASNYNVNIASRRIAAQNGFNSVDDLIPKNLKAKRDALIKIGYDPVKNTGPTPIDTQFINDINNISANSSSANRAFPGVFPNPVKDKLEGLTKVSSAETEGVMSSVQEFRDAAHEAYAKGEAGVGKAYVAASHALEDLVQRGLAAKGPAAAKILDTYKTTRQKLAVNFATTEAVRRGGDMKPQVIAKMHEDGVPLTGALEELGALANNFPHYAMDPAKVSVPMINWKIPAAIGAGTGTFSKTGNVPLSVMAAAAPFSPDILRTMLLSNAVQKGLPNITPEMAQQINLFSRQYNNQANQNPVPYK